MRKRNFNKGIPKDTLKIFCLKSENLFTTNEKCNIINKVKVERFYHSRADAFISKYECVC